MVGAIFALFAMNRNIQTDAHLICHFRPSGLVSSTDGLLDHSEIHFDIQIMVRDDAWPDA
jgi:hypothetical protein